MITDFEKLKQREESRIARLQKVCKDYADLRAELPQATRHSIMTTMAKAYSRLNQETIERGDHIDNPYVLMPVTRAGIEYILKTNNITL